MPLSHQQCRGEGLCQMKDAQWEVGTKEQELSGEASEAPWGLRE